MPVTAEQLDAFYRFGAEQIANGSSDLSWEELFILWDSQSVRDEVNAAIREGIADVDAGRYEPADKSLADIRSEFGFKE